METQEIINKLKKGLDEEYYIAASGSTRTKNNENLILTIKEAQKICSLLDIIVRSEQLFCPACNKTDLHTTEHNYLHCRNCNTYYEQVE